MYYKINKRGFMNKVYYRSVLPGVSINVEVMDKLNAFCCMGEFKLSKAQVWRKACIYFCRSMGYDNLDDFFAQNPTIVKTATYEKIILNYLEEVNKYAGN